MNSQSNVNSHVGFTERPVASERMRPLARTPYYAARAAKARVLARTRLRSAALDQPPVFIIGCGRSGTTLLGQLYAEHPAVSYLYEPYDLWAAIEPATDFVQLYAHGEHHCLLDASWATDRARRRFRRLMAVPIGMTLVEKSPINALRIGYLNAIAPEAYFIHIVRDGIDVSRSIERMAAVTRRMAFRPSLNEWWGVGDTKWMALEHDGQAAGYYPDEVRHLTTDAQRGAYEWLVSLNEVAKWRVRLGSRFFEIRYQDLTDDPSKTLGLVTDAVGLSCPARWLEQTTAQVRSARGSDGEPLALPDQMGRDFNQLQARFGFTGRAILGNHDQLPDGAAL